MVMGNNDNNVNGDGATGNEVDDDDNGVMGNEVEDDGGGAMGDDNDDDNDGYRNDDNDDDGDGASDATTRGGMTGGTKRRVAIKNDGVNLSNIISNLAEVRFF
jgi:hypothetical protein